MTRWVVIEVDLHQVTKAVLQRLGLRVAVSGYFPTVWKKASCSLILGGLAVVARDWIGGVVAAVNGG